MYFWVLVLVFGSQFVKNVITTASNQHPVQDFHHYTLVKPRIYFHHGRERREITTSKSKDGQYHLDNLTLSLPVDGEEFLLDLTLNKQLISKGFFRKVQKNGGYEITKPTPEEADLCHYGGKVRGRPNSWVALSTCDGLSGVIYDGEEMHYVERKNGLGGLESEHVVYKHSDLVEHNNTCGYFDDVENLGKGYNHRYKRTAEVNKELVRGPYSSNKESKYVEMLLVVGNSQYKALGENTENVERYCKSLINMVNGLYAPLNIFVALVGVVIWTEHDEINISQNGDSTLSNFLRYRRQQLLKDHPNDNAQLIIKEVFEGGVIGKALKGPICTFEYSGAVSIVHSPVIGLVATTVAHQLGHNFGMEHDTDECECPEHRCIMASSTSTTPPTHWSSCSLKSLLLAFKQGMDYCLRNKPAALFESPTCGNGFVESGEECDCGLPELCNNTCCNATTCTLHSNATCATGECCDLTTCKLKNAGILCRSADYECDLPEYCTGESEYCPDDVYKMDTEICQDGRAFCYRGSCRTRTDQCKILWGQTGRSSDEACYRINIKGNRHGNCGYDKLNNSFSKCNNEDIMCGLLQCQHINYDRLEFGMESVAVLSHSFLNLKGKIISCRTAIIDLGLDRVDPGYVPDGAKCGEDKMCVNQKCVSVTSLQKPCTENCNNNGWCDNVGNCHCNGGFEPPFCKNPVSATTEVTESESTPHSDASNTSTVAPALIS